jgi:hypothetical protein
MDIYLGVDPGKEGALAILTDNGDRSWDGVWDYLDQECLHRLKDISLFIVKSKSKSTVIGLIEKVNADPSWGKTSIFNFGDNFGQWRGRFDALSIPYTLLSPSKWQKEVFDSGSNIKDRKVASLELARRLFPWADLKNKGHHNRSDALLIAEALRRLHKQGKL